MLSHSLRTHRPDIQSVDGIDVGEKVVVGIDSCECADLSGIEGQLTASNHPPSPTVQYCDISTNASQNGRVPVHLAPAVVTHGDWEDGIDLLRAQVDASYCEITGEGNHPIPPQDEAVVDRPGMASHYPASHFHFFLSRSPQLNYFFIPSLTVFYVSATGEEELVDSMHL